VSAADYAIGLHAASLVADGGTLQIGIGSLGDAIAQALIVRDRHGAEYRRMLETLCPDGLDGRARRAASTGACTAARRCSSTASCKLIEAGIIRREVFADADAAAAAQQRRHRRRDRHARHAERAARTPAASAVAAVDAADLDFLQHFGVLRAGVRLDGAHLVLGATAAAPTWMTPAPSTPGQHHAGRAAAPRHRS
jgi:hypothetical protein